MSETMTDQLLNAEGIGEALGMSARSVLRQFERGRFPGYRVSPRRVAFRLSEVLEAVKEHHDELHEKGPQ
jgi:predicted DNA-binding transcriptional regulator AlpA